MPTMPRGASACPHRICELDHSIRRPLGSRRKHVSSRVRKGSGDVLLAIVKKIVDVPREHDRTRLPRVDHPGQSAKERIRRVWQIIHWYFYGHITHELIPLESNAVMVHSHSRYMNLSAQKDCRNLIIPTSTFTSQVRSPIGQLIRALTANPSTESHKY